MSLKPRNSPTSRYIAFSTLMALMLVPLSLLRSEEPAVADAQKAQSLGEAYPLSLARGEPGLTLDELTAVALEQHPRLQRVRWAVEAARGRALQAGLCPNPTVNFTWDELGDRTGPSGVNTLPLVSQEIVLGRKLKISRDAGLREVDQATWASVGERYALLSEIRVAFYDALALQSRIQILDEILNLADQSVSQTSKLLSIQQVARLDLVQLEVEAERLRAEREATERELPGALKQLAATAGRRDMTITRVSGALDATLPSYDLDRAQQYVVMVHPEVEVARYAVERARLLARRAEVEPIPNVNVGAGYVRQNQNRSDDYVLSATVTVPLWNRNQGNIHAAEAELCAATQEVRKVENDLAERVATAMRDYTSARLRADRYRDVILPRVVETYNLSMTAYQGGQFEYLRVLEAQRALAQSRLEYLRALGDAWKAAARISGLTIEDAWPPAEAVIPPAPAAAPSAPQSDGER